MEFFEISTQEEFTRLNNWLVKQSVPLDIYLNGITYHFDTPREVFFFLVGVEAGLEIEQKFGY